MRTCTNLDFKVSIDQVRRSPIEASKWSKKFLSDISKKGGKEICIEESIKIEIRFEIYYLRLT
jgi:hypothetical protein